MKTDAPSPKVSEDTKTALSKTEGADNDISFKIDVATPEECAMIEELLGGYVWFEVCPDEDIEDREG